MINFQSAEILSLSSKKAFRHTFSSKVNIITGENDTGKSSFIKILYYTLGADVRLDKTWKNDDFISKVVIQVNNESYSFIRHHKRISIFDNSNESKLLVTSLMREEIAAKVSEIFDFKLKLVNVQTGIQTQAYPAALYLPFYIDQDSGWTKPLESFDGLRMYKDWQRNILQYHVAIKPKQYYELQGNLVLINREIDELLATLKAIKGAKKKFENSFGRVLFDVDVEYYEALLDRFLQRCQTLHEEECKYRVRLIELLSKRDQIALDVADCKEQLANINLDEISKSTRIETQYSLIESREQLLDLIPKLFSEKTEIENEISNTKFSLKNSTRLSEELKSMLLEVKQEISLQDVIKSQASKQVELTFDSQIEDLEQKIGKLTGEKEAIDENMAKYTDSKRTANINSCFRGFLKDAQNELDIKNPVSGSVIQYGKITKSETGSRAPRAILSYYYALLRTIKEKSSIPMLPVVIDSPKQQDPDDATIEKIFKLCVDGLSTNNQLIIGSVSYVETNKKVKILEMKNKHSLLQHEFYDEVYSRIMPLYEQAIKFSLI